VFTYNKKKTKIFKKKAMNIAYKISLPDLKKQKSLTKEQKVFINTETINTEKVLTKMKNYEVDPIENVIVMLNVQKVDESWKLHENTYLSEFTNSIKNFHSKQDLVNDRVDTPPEIFLRNGNIRFENGRHRFANLRDVNVTTMPFIVSQQEAKEFQTRFA
jgi:hypothetical protein